LTDFFSVESEVAKAIADQLRVKLTGREEQEITAKPTDNPEAYDAYLRGLAYSLKAQHSPANSLGGQKHLREGAANGSKAKHSSTRPSASIPAMLTCLASMHSPTFFFVVFPKHYTNLTRFSILLRTTWRPWR
jgi:hypothetical protein